MIDYNSLSDNDLIVLSRQREENAEEELISRYKRKAAICARKFYILGGDDEDLLQEAMLGLLKAVRTFDDEKGATFSTYAETCIRRRLMDVISMKRYTEFISTEDQTREVEEPVCDNDPETLLIENEHYEEIMDSIKETLSSYEQKVLSLYLSGMTCQDISVELSKAIGSVYNAVQRIRSKIGAKLFVGDSSVV